MGLQHCADRQVPHGFTEAGTQLLGQQQVPEAVQQPRQHPARHLQGRHAQGVHLAQLRHQVDLGGCTCQPSTQGLDM